MHAVLSRKLCVVVLMVLLRTCTSAAINITSSSQDNTAFSSDMAAAFSSNNPSDELVDNEKGISSDRNDHIPANSNQEEYRHPKRLSTNAIVNSLNCNERTKDVYLTDYPYSQLTRDYVLGTLEDAEFIKSRYFTTTRNSTNGHPYNERTANNPETYGIKTMGKGVRLFSPETVSPDPNIKRRFLCFGDSIVRETCNTLGMLIAGAKVHTMAKMMGFHHPKIPQGKVIFNKYLSLQGQLHDVYSEPGTSVLFKWSSFYDETAEFGNILSQFYRRNQERMNATNTRTTIILGYGMHALFRKVGTKRLTIKGRLERLQASLSRMFLRLKDLVPLHSIDVVWIGSGTNDVDLLHAIPRTKRYYYSFFDHFKMERLPVYERTLVESLQQQYPEITLHHVPRALHDRKYPGVRCDGMHFAKNRPTDACSGLAEVLMAFVNIILNVVEGVHGGVAHRPDEFLPFVACPTKSYDLFG